MNTSIASICHNFALMNKNVDKIVIGIDSFNNLQENLNMNWLMDSDLYRLLKNMKEEDNNILLPMNWAN